MHTAQVTSVQVDNNLLVTASTDKTIGVHLMDPKALEMAKFTSLKLQLIEKPNQVVCKNLGETKKLYCCDMTGDLSVFNLK